MRWMAIKLNGGLTSIGWRGWQGAATIAHALNKAIRRCVLSGGDTTVDYEDACRLSLSKVLIMIRLPAYHRNWLLQI